MLNKICICGAGTMGSGIAQAVAQSGFETILFDIGEDILIRAKKQIGEDLEVLVKKNKINSGEKTAILNRLSFTTDIKACKGEIIIEAIVEKMEAKRDLLIQLEEVNNADAVFASNTSSLSITAIAKTISHPERMIGMHFFNPATIMKLVELVKTAFTNEHAIRMALELIVKMGKTAVYCKDAPGFIVNHVARPYYLEALRLVETGAVDYETVDSLMEATGFKMGPFRLMDLIGNDINYAVSQSVYEALNKPERLRPSSIQEDKVRQGELGKKTGKGYYTYG